MKQNEKWFFVCRVLITATLLAIIMSSNNARAETNDVVLRLKRTPFTLWQMGFYRLEDHFSRATQKLGLSSVLIHQDKQNGHYNINAVDMDINNMTYENCTNIRRKILEEMFGNEEAVSATISVWFSAPGEYNRTIGSQIAGIITLAVSDRNGDGCFGPVNEFWGSFRR
jgi:hypothetical protein